MNIETRKLIFIQELVKLQNEDVLIGLENFLNEYKSSSSQNDFSSMSLEKFNSDIDKSFEDVSSGKLISAKNLKFQSCN
jgi:hypothetical protein